MAIIRNLQCELGPKELAAKKDELVVAHTELESLESKLADVKAEYTEQIRETQTRIKRTVREIREKSEERPVECTEVQDPRSGKVSIVRSDTGATIETRRMTVEERQPNLPGTKDEEPAADDKAKERAAGKRGKKAEASAEA